MVDLEKVKAAEQTALEDLNKTESWIDKNPRLAALATFSVGILVGIVGTLWHLHK